MRVRPIVIEDDFEKGLYSLGLGRDLAVLEVLLARELDLLGLEGSALEDTGNAWGLGGIEENDEKAGQVSNLDIISLGANYDDRKRLASLAPVGLGESIIPLLHGLVTLLVSKIKEEDTSVGSAEEAIVGETTLGVEVGVVEG